jgi:hypothetical protein
MFASIRKCWADDGRYGCAPGRENKGTAYPIAVSLFPDRGVSPQRTEGNRRSLKYHLRSRGKRIDGRRFKLVELRPSPFLSVLTAVYLLSLPFCTKWKTEVPFMQKNIEERHASPSLQNPFILLPPLSSSFIIHHPYFICPQPRNP